MKELSIEEKAKLYDEAIIRGSRLWESDTITRENYEYIFPELKESDDERIRKALIRFHKSTIDIYGIKGEDILAWLEKQGEQPRKVSIWKHWKDGIAGNGEGKLIYLVKVGNTYRLTSCLGFECDYIELSELDSLMFEKQGEKSSDKIVEKARTEKQRVLLTETDGSANIDWDCRSLQDVKLLLEYGLDYIKKLEKQGEQKPVPKFKVGDTMRTLQEATDGYTDGMPVVASIDEEYYHCNNELIAIKDQDDYEYPPMNRRQKPINKVKPKFKVGDCIRHKGRNESYKIVTIDDNYYFCENNHAWAIRSQNHFELVDQKPAWSEEDERMMMFCCDYLDDNQKSWLLSLKERYTWKPSDEQMKILDLAIKWGIIKGSNEETILVSLFNDLKKLKEE